jgi:pimeloyl-ACP methyl ester carboxylesterase
MIGAAPGGLIIDAGDAVFSFLEAGSGPPLVLLHGIGSAAVSFCHQLDGLSADFRVIAWDAPGYGGSTPLATSELDPGGYAAALKCFLDALALDRIHLLGHSLGTLIAARFTAEQPERVITLTLSSVARGHGRLSAAEQRRALAARLNDVAELGPRGRERRAGPGSGRISSRRLLGPRFPTS